MVHRRLPPKGPPNGFTVVVAAVVVAELVPITTTSPSFKPSNISVLLPSLIPVLTDTAARTGLLGVERDLIAAVRVEDVVGG